MDLTEPQGEILKPKKLHALIQTQLAWIQTAFGMPVLDKNETTPVTVDQILQKLQTSTDSTPVAVRILSKEHPDLDATWLMLGLVEKVVTQGPTAYQITIQYGYNR